MNYWTYVLCLRLLLRVLIVRLVAMRHAAMWGVPVTVDARARRGSVGVFQVQPVTPLVVSNTSQAEQALQYFRSREARRA